MFLVCPNCEARYEVDDSAVPLEGREVQCTNCSEIWFQERALKLSSAAMTPADTPNDDFEEDEVDEDLKSSFSKILADAPPPKPVEPAEPPIEYPARTKPTESGGPSENNIADLAAAAIFRSRRMEAAMEQSDASKDAQETIASNSAPATKAVTPEPFIEPQQPASGQSVIDILRREAEYSSGQVAKPAEEVVEPTPTVETPKPVQAEITAPEPEIAAPEPTSEPAPAQTEASAATAKSVADILIDRQRAAKSVDPDAPVVRPKTVEDGLRTAPETQLDAPTFEQPSADIAPPPESINDDPQDRPRGKKVFANVDEVESKLDLASDEVDQVAKATAEEELDDLPDPLPIGAMEGTNHFMGGLYAGLICVVVAALLYLFGTQISNQFPGLEESITSYTERVDNGRLAVQNLYSEGGEPGLGNFFSNALSAFRDG